MNLSITAIAGSGQIWSYLFRGQFQASILRKFRTALEICRSTLELLKEQRPQLDVQELRQLQLIEGWWTVMRRVARPAWGVNRPRLIHCHARSWGCSTLFDANLILPPRNRLLLAFDDGAIQPWFPFGFCCCWC